VPPAAYRGATQEAPDPRPVDPAVFGSRHRSRGEIGNHPTKRPAPLPLAPPHGTGSGEQPPEASPPGGCWESWDTRIQCHPGRWAACSHTVVYQTHPPGADPSKVRHACPTSAPCNARRRGPNRRIGTLPPVGLDRASASHAARGHRRCGSHPRPKPTTVGPADNPRRCGKTLPREPVGNRDPDSHPVPRRLDRCKGHEWRGSFRSTERRRPRSPGLHPTRGARECRRGRDKLISSMLRTTACCGFAPEAKQCGPEAQPFPFPLRLSSRPRRHRGRPCPDPCRQSIEAGSISLIGLQPNPPPDSLLLNRRLLL
jgi:hypothetical protein